MILSMTATLLKYFWLITKNCLYGYLLYYNTEAVIKLRAISLVLNVIIHKKAKAVKDLTAHKSIFVSCYSTIQTKNSKLEIL